MENDVQCKICKTTLKMKQKCTSNAKKHIKHRHKEIVSTLQTFDFFTLHKIKSFHSLHFLRYCTGSFQVSELEKKEAAYDAKTISQFLVTRLADAAII